MFDYQAGEKYKLTLILVGFAGVMAGMFFTLLLSPAPHPHQVARQKPKWADHPDVNGGGQSAGRHGRAIDGYQNPGGAAQAHAPANEPYIATDQDKALSLVDQWLPSAWDFSAATAGNSQENAIAYMTEECAAQYRQNIWTSELASQIAQSGATSRFDKRVVKVGEQRNDGAVVVIVEGQQVITMPGKGAHANEVKFEYLVKETPDKKIKIAGFCEAGKSHGL